MGVVKGEWHEGVLAIIYTMCHPYIESATALSDMLFNVIITQCHVYVKINVLELGMPF